MTAKGTTKKTKDKQKTFQNEYPFKYMKQVLTFVRAINKPENKAHNKVILNAAFRHANDCVYPDYCSKKALAVAEAKDINLQQMTWATQTAHDKNRKIFHLEHCYTVYDLVERVLETKDDIESILHDNITAWVLKTENALLDSAANPAKQSFRKHRVKYGGWEKCYDVCKIELEENKFALKRKKNKK